MYSEKISEPNVSQYSSTALYHWLAEQTFYNAGKFSETVQRHHKVLVIVCSSASAFR